MFKNIFLDIYKYKNLVYQVGRREIVYRLRENILTCFVTWFLPFINVLIFNYLKSTEIIQSRNTPLPYALYVLYGSILWYLFSRIILKASRALIEYGEEIKRINFPKETLIYGKIIPVLLDFIIHLIIFIIIYLIYMKEFPYWRILFLPIVLLLIIIFAVGLANIFAILYVFIRDIFTLISFFMPFWMLITPVVYPITIEDFKGIHYINPMSGFIVFAHNLLLPGSLNFLQHFLISSLWAILIFILGTYIFRIGISKSIDYL